MQFELFNQSKVYVLSKDTVLVSQEDNWSRLTAEDLEEMSIEEFNCVCSLVGCNGSGGGDRRELSG